MSAEEIRNQLRQWAQSLPSTVRVYFFGSRQKGTERPESDLDVAVEVLLPFEDDSERILWWMDAPKDDWERDLEARTGHKIDLEQYHPVHTPCMKQFLAESSEVIFESPARLNSSE